MRLLNIQLFVKVITPVKADNHGLTITCLDSRLRGNDNKVADRNVRPPRFG